MNWSKTTMNLRLNAEIDSIPYNIKIIIPITFESPEEGRDNEKMVREELNKLGFTLNG